MYLLIHSFQLFGHILFLNFPFVDFVGRYAYLLKAEKNMRKYLTYLKIINNIDYLCYYE